MHFRTALLTFTALGLLAACGNSSPNSSADTPRNGTSSTAMDATSDRKLVKAMVAKMGELADTLETVKDEESARAATQTIAGLAKDMETLANKVDGNSAGTKMSAIMEANSQDFRAIQGRIVSQVARLAITKPELMEIVAEEMEKLDF